MLPGQPDCPLANLRGKGWGMLRNGSSLSRVGASENPGAVHPASSEAGAESLLARLNAHDDAVKLPQPAQ